MKWRKTQINRVAKVISGYAFKSASFCNEAKIPVIKISNIRRGYVNLDEAAYVEDSFLSIDPKYQVTKGDILISLTGSHITLPNSVVGRVAKYRLEQLSLLNQRAGKFLCNEALINRDFLYYSLSQDDVLERIASYAQGAANQANISPSNVESVEISLPPLPIQQKITSILSAYDDLIENNLRRIQLLELAAKCEYQLLIREKKVRVLSIEEVCEVVGGGTPSTKIAEYWKDGDAYWFTPTDLTKHHSVVLIDCEKCITAAGLGKSSAKLFPPYTIMMTSRATIGYFGVFSKPACTNQGFINILPKKNIYRYYLLYNLMDRKEELISHANGSTYLEITKGNFKKLNTQIPSDEKLLEVFEKNTQSKVNLIENLLLQNKNLRQARNILLPKLMSGEIEV